MHANLTLDSIFKIFQQISQSIHSTMEPQLMLQGVSETIGWHLELDRCAALIFDDDRQQIEVVAEFHREGLKPIGKRVYQLRTSSEWYHLLAEGKPVPLRDIRIETGVAGSMPELDCFIDHSQSEALIAFPLVSHGRLLGCLTMHSCSESRTFSDELLELGEAVAEELALALNQARQYQVKDKEGRIFRDARLPLIVLAGESCKVLQANRASLEMLALRGQDLRETSFLEFLSESDSQRFSQAVANIGVKTPVVTIPQLNARNSLGQPLVMDACLSVFTHNHEDALLLTIHPLSEHVAAPEAKASGRVDGNTRLEELVAKLSKQLHWERVARNIISTVHLSIDRDTVLQSAVDNLGRALAVSRCLVIRTDGPAPPAVTHEYAQPDIFPLGLGRTSDFPSNAVTSFSGKTSAIADLTRMGSGSELSAQDAESLLDSGARALAGAVIGHHGYNYGVIVVIQNDQPRHWSLHELEILDTVAYQTAIALNNAQSYAQLKDQLFNMDLIGNLTQQLTNALDLAARDNKAARPFEAQKPPNVSPPLSLRELEVLKLIASGLANREIAQRLFLTESTVELHASRIRKKLKLKSRTALVKYACDNHLV